MKRIATVLLRICVVSVFLLYFATRSMSAEEETGVNRVKELLKENADLKKLAENLRRELEQTRAEMLDAQAKIKTKIEDTQKKAEEELLKKTQQALEGYPVSPEADEYQNLLAVLEHRLQAMEKGLKALDLLRVTEDKRLEAVAEKKYKAAQGAMRQYRKALDEFRVPEKAEKMLQEFIAYGRKPDVGTAKEALEDFRKAKQKQAISKDRLAEALSKYEEALRQTTPQQFAEVMRDRLLAQVYKQDAVQRKTKKLEKAILSGDDAGLLLQLRLEKVDLCRKLGKLDEAEDELEKIIEENLGEETTNAARWTLIEVLQEQKKTEDAIDLLKEIVETSKSPEERRSALYAMIEMAGDDPEARLRTTEEVIEWLKEIVEDQREAAEEQREKARGDACKNNLKTLMLAVRMWASDHDGEFAEKLSDLYPDYVDSVKLFTCPSARGAKITKKEEIDSKTSYIYVTGLTEAGPADAVVLYENPSNHDGEGGHVAFADGHVEWLRAEKMKETVERGRQKESF